MRNFLLGVVLGLLAVVHSTPVTMTQIVPKTENDVSREVLSDGFLLYVSSPPSVTTASPRTNMSVQPSQHTGSTNQAPRHDLDVGEGSGLGEINDMFTVGTMTQSSSSASDESVGSQTFVPTTFNILSTMSDSGSGNYEDVVDFTTTTASTTSETSPASSTSKAPLVPDIVPRIFGANPEHTTESFSGSGSGSGQETEQGPVRGEASATKAETTDASMPAGHTTPDWIIILAFIVGVAALVLLCVAIATRDKWNAPKYAAEPAVNTNASNQQRALEMETFLQEMPKENGKAAEYTVIPLEELPENYSSH